MKTLLLATACLVLNIIVVQPQSKKESLRPDAPIKETIAWLKSNIPYSYTLPTNGSSYVTRWTIGSLQSKDCKLSYDITIQSMDPERSSFERQEWVLDLAGLNPQMIRIKPATKKDPVQIEVTSFNPHDPDLIRQAQANGGAVVVKGKAIWQRLRQDDHLVREGFETHTRFFTRDEERAAELAAAFKRGIELCRPNAGS
jgi:hypothetical protein